MICDFIVLHHTSQFSIQNLSIMVITIKESRYDVTRHSLHELFVAIERANAQNVGGRFEVYFTFGTLFIAPVHAMDQRLRIHCSLA